MEDKAKILQKLEEVAEELENDMTESGWTGRTVTLKYKLDSYQSKRKRPLSNTFFMNFPCCSIHAG